jgi:hypothetical protein
VIALVIVVLIVKSKTGNELSQQKPEGNLPLVDTSIVSEASGTMLFVV